MNAIKVDNEKNVFYYVNINNVVPESNFLRNYEEFWGCYLGVGSFLVYLKLFTPTNLIKLHSSMIILNYNFLNA